MYMVDIVVEKPSPAPWKNLPICIIQTYWAPENNEYPRASDPQVPNREAYFLPIKLAHGPAIKLPQNIPATAILTANKKKLNQTGN